MTMSVAMSVANNLAKMTVAAALFVVMAQPSLGQDLKYKPITVKTPDGLTISAQEWGNPAGPEILFIHGFSQSHLSWMRQTDGELGYFQTRFNVYDRFGIVCPTPGCGHLVKRLVQAGRSTFYCAHCQR